MSRFFFFPFEKSKVADDVSSMLREREVAVTTSRAPDSISKKRKRFKYIKDSIIVYGWSKEDGEERFSFFIYFIPRFSFF